MLRDNILPFLADLKARKVTNRAVAAKLRVSEEHISRVLRQLGVVKDRGSQRDNAKALVQARYDYRKTVAQSLSPKQAAKAAKCSVRTIYRWRQK